MTDSQSPNPPSGFIAQWVRLLSNDLRGGRALDVATGRGRNALAIAAAGFRVIGIDVQLDALASARASALSRGLHLSLVCADLTQTPLPPGSFSLIVVVRYLDRQLFPSLIEALAPGGVLLYETFTENQLRYDRGPRSRDHLLAPGELRMRMRGLEVLFDEEISAPEAVARIAVRRRTTPARG
jgi:tellurite methyltransferase